MKHHILHFSSHSPKALCALRTILGMKQYIPNQHHRAGQLYAQAEQQYDEAATLHDKAIWLEVLYRMTGVFTPLMQPDPYSEDECDERFDDLLAEGLQPTDTLLCYRMHRNLVTHAPYDPQLRHDFLARCRQWVRDLTDAEPQMWHTLPLTERLHRLWLLAVTDYKATLHWDPDHRAPYRWHDVEECFHRCRQQFLRLQQPDVDTLTTYYWTLCQLFPDADGTQAEAYDEYFQRFHAVLSTLTPDTDHWWQLMAIEEHHRKDLTKPFRRHSLPDLSTLSPTSLRDFRLTYYQWEYRDTDFIDLQEERDIRAYATECAQHLYPLLTKPTHTTQSTHSTHTPHATHWLTLLLTVILAELHDLLPRLIDRIEQQLPLLPDTRHKTHLLAHLALLTDDESLLAEALDTAQSWPADTLDEEDRLLLHHLLPECTPLTLNS